MNRIIFVGYKENDVNNSRIKIGRILTATLMVACLVIISIATSGCVMQVDETEDFDAIELELAEATETDVKFAQEPLACV
ncbi:hypothetical protein KJ662_03795, partial [Patescibacteria group bacterium]|nr:hypothetical protein [Patescibacteria group bacterium]